MARNRATIGTSAFSTGRDGESPRFCGRPKRIPGLAMSCPMLAAQQFFESGAGLLAIGMRQVFDAQQGDGQ